MPQIRVRILGAPGVEIGGQDRTLTPLTVRMLLRLVAAGGRPVMVEQLYADVWGPGDFGHVKLDRKRNEVQKRVFELRSALGDGSPDIGGGRILRTEQLSDGRTRRTAYRLVLEPEQLDSAEFADLARRGLDSAPATAAALLPRALALWQGRPFSGAEDMEAVVAPARQLDDLRSAARIELSAVLTELGRWDEALEGLEQLSAEHPEDRGVAEQLVQLRARRRDRASEELGRREFAGLQTAVTLRRGDLFDQQDANLVIGFTDTFDTLVDGDFVISRDSVQGQLLDRHYSGSVAALDAAVRNALRYVRAEPVGRENARDKPRGKRLRYPIGTTAALPLDGRRVFAIAYSRQGNDLKAQSSPELLRESLDLLWPAVAVHGLLRPVAVPVVGSGLARIALGQTELVVMLIDSFLSACRKHAPLCPELRIVLRPENIGKIQVLDVVRYLESLDHEGRAAA